MVQSAPATPMGVPSRLPALPRVGDLLAGLDYQVAGSGAGREYAAHLLASLGAGVARTPGARDPHPAIEWARSGAMALTGPPEGPPRLAPGPLASCARAALHAMALVAEGAWSSNLDGAALLAERAAILGLARRGTTSAGGTCRMLRTRDRWIAVNLARPDDLALLPAWLGEGETRDPWGFVAERVGERPAAPLVERARLLGLPVAVATDPEPCAPPWLRIAARGPATARPRAAAPLVVDLSSLWAGPLCTHLLERAGARVVRVESLRRPDGARFGPVAFHDLLNARKASVALDFTASGDRAQLRQLLERADVVVESARPRALAQLDIDAAAQVRARPGVTWVSITGYGRSEPQANWVAFGDDAAVAAGLAVATGPPGGPPLFCGDAVADPLTGIHAALAALASWAGGGGHLLDLALRDVVAHVLGFSVDEPEAVVRPVGDGWEVAAGTERALVAPPRARPALAPAPQLGADTDRVLRKLAAPC